MSIYANRANQLTAQNFISVLALVTVHCWACALFCFFLTPASVSVFYLMTVGLTLPNGLVGDRSSLILLTFTWQDWWHLTVTIKRDLYFIIHNFSFFKPKSWKVEFRWTWCNSLALAYAKYRPMSYRHELIWRNLTCHWIFKFLFQYFSNKIICLGEHQFALW